MTKATATHVSDNATKILLAVKGENTTTAAVAKALRSNAKSVGRQIGQLKKADLLRDDERRGFVVTKKGAAMLRSARGPRKGSKMARATEIVHKMADSARKDIIARLTSKSIGLTKAGASTYITMIRQRDEQHGGRASA